MNRIVQPETLDELPPADPRAIRARRDLRRINFFMGHGAMLANALRQHFSNSGAIPRRLVEIGCGDATLLLKIARKFPAWKNVEAILVDRLNIVSAETLNSFRDLGWQPKVFTGDVFEWMARREPSDAIIANLFLHHFEAPQLRHLFELVAAQTGCFAACEPQRTKFVPVARDLLWLIGCSRITRDDADLSIRAGFFGNELAPLWPAHDCWQISETDFSFTTHRFVAMKNS